MIFLLLQSLQAMLTYRLRLLRVCGCSVAEKLFLFLLGDSLGGLVLCSAPPIVEEQLMVTEHPVVISRLVIVRLSGSSGQAPVRQSAGTMDGGEVLGWGGRGRGRRKHGHPDVCAAITLLPAFCSDIVHELCIRQQFTSTPVRIARRQQLAAFPACNILKLRFQILSLYDQSVSFVHRPNASLKILTRGKYNWRRTPRQLFHCELTKSLTLIPRPPQALRSVFSMSSADAVAS